MNNTNTGGPAFPRAPFEYIDNETGLDWSVREQSGMTLRDYFAAKAMQATLADDAYVERTETPSEWVALVARASYDIADALLKAREA